MKEKNWLITTKKGVMVKYHYFLVTANRQSQSMICHTIRHSYKSRSESDHPIHRHRSTNCKHLINA